jgi:hypothetical protein
MYTYFNRPPCPPSLGFTPPTSGPWWARLSPHGHLLGSVTTTIFGGVPMAFPIIRPILNQHHGPRQPRPIPLWCSAGGSATGGTFTGALLSIRLHARQRAVWAVTVSGQYFKAPRRCVSTAPWRTGLCAGRHPAHGAGAG